MPFLELFDETLDINSVEHYDLSVQMSRDGVAFSVLDTIRNKFILLRSYDPDPNKKFAIEQIEEIVNKDDFLNRKYRRTKLVMPSLRSTLVPAPLYDPGRKDEYFAFNHSQGMTGVILSNRISNPDSFLLFETDKLIYEFASRFFKGAYPEHHLKILLELLSHASGNSSGHVVHAHIEPDFFNLIVFENNNLIFDNSFNYRNISDILYFILNVFSSTGIGQEGSITLSGNIEMYDELYSNLAQYIRSVKFAEPHGTFNFSYVFNELGIHRYINLFNAAN